MEKQTTIGTADANRGADNPGIGTNIIDGDGRADNPGIGIGTADVDGGVDNSSSGIGTKDANRRTNNTSTGINTGIGISTARRSKQIKCKQKHNGRRQKS